jgi:hypothetical protein
MSDNTGADEPLPNDTGRGLIRSVGCEAKALAYEHILKHVGCSPRAARCRDQQLSLRYCTIGVIWLATICQRPCIFTYTLMVRYGPLLSLPP